MAIVVHLDFWLSISVINKIIKMAKSKLVNYVKESYEELKTKVSWPTWKELQSSAVIVSIASLIIAVVILLMDLSFEKIMEFIY